MCAADRDIENKSRLAEIKGSRARLASFALSDHHLESRPDFTHRAHFDIHQAKRQRDLANCALGDIAGHFGSLFQPRHPDKPRLYELLRNPSRCFAKTSRSVTNRWLAPSASDVQVANVQCVFVDELATGLHLIPHEHTENLIGTDRIVDTHLQQGSCVGIHRRFPKLVGVHFA